jgi:hypothetical protein
MISQSNLLAFFLLFFLFNHRFHFLNEVLLNFYLILLLLNIYQSIRLILHINKHDNVFKKM